LLFRARRKFFLQQTGNKFRYYRHKHLLDMGLTQDSKIQAIQRHIKCASVDFYNARTG
jgi:hypothetical protein